MDIYTVKKINNSFDKEISLPGSKSITLRDLLIAALAKGKSKISSYAVCADSEVMLNALEKLGVKIDYLANDQLLIDPENLDLSSDLDIYLGESGVSTRLLLALAYLRKAKTSFDGAPSLKARPQGYLLDALASLGAEVESNQGKLPISINSIDNNFLNHKVSLKGDLSSQFFTALMIIGNQLPQVLEIDVIGELVSKPYIDITINEINKFNGSVINNNYQNFQCEKKEYKGSEITVEGDASGASYFLALATILGSRIKINNLGSSTNQGDLEFYKVCEKLGAKVNLAKDSIEIIGSKNSLNELKEIDLESMPDVAPTLMAIAPLIPGKTLITGLQTLKHKECDRISVPARQLSKLGVEVREGDDFIEILEKKDFSGINLEAISIGTYDDHRIAMSFGVLGSYIGGLKIEDPNCVSKTFPRFWEYIERLS